MNRNLLAILSVSAASLFLAGCAGSAIPRTGTPSGTKTPPPARVTPPPVVRPVQNNILIGHSAEALSRSIGRPRIDVTEGSGRKMQFLGANCVLDVYFYPPSAGAAPVATHVDARSPDGRDMDVNRCAEAIRRR